MEKLLIIVDLGKHSGHNFLNSAIGSQTLPKGVSRIADNSWLVDAHTSFAFVSLIVNICQRDLLPVFLLPVPENMLVEVKPDQAYYVRENL